MPDLTDTELDAMRARCDVATAGPWERFGYIGEGGLSRVRVSVGTDRVGREVFANIPATSADADFIGHARTDMPRLIDEVRRLRETAWTHKKLAAAVREVVAEMRSRATAKYTVQSVAFVLLDYAATLAEALEGSK